MKLTLGFSPCPNDTFIFDALVNKKIDTHGLDFEIQLEDVETLNQWAFEGKLDISKLSYPSFFQNLNEYVLLNSGAALGNGVGPILIKNENFLQKNISEHSIAIPGINTTANLLLSFAYPSAQNKIPMLFSEIENAVLSGKTDLGVIIHENRFTYQQKGLIKITDLGEVWEAKMKMPIPLGGIAIKRSLDHKMALQIERLIKNSIEYAFSKYPLIPDYVKNHSQEMSEDIMRKHISLYVNKFSLNLGDEGRNAIQSLFKLFSELQAQEADSHSSSRLFLL